MSEGKAPSRSARNPAAAMRSPDSVPGSRVTVAGQGIRGDDGEGRFGRADDIAVQLESKAYVRDTGLGRWFLGGSCIRSRMRGSSARVHVSNATERQSKGRIRMYLSRSQDFELGNDRCCDWRCSSKLPAM